MENTATIALSRQAVLRRQMDVIANNMANMNTTGYKAEKMMFVDHVVKSRGADQLLPEKLQYVRDIATYRDMAEGPLTRTGNPLDVAVRGEGMLEVETPQGERMIQGGALRIDDQGQLVTQHGFPVLSEGDAPIVFEVTDTEIEIGRDGTISTNNGVLGRLAIVKFENPQELEITEGGLYAAPEGIEGQVVENPDVVQGMLEGSNVEPILEITRMMDTHRAYTSVKKMIDKEDERVKNMMKAYDKAA